MRAACLLPALACGLVLVSPAAASAIAPPADPVTASRVPQAAALEAATLAQDAAIAVWTAAGARGRTPPGVAIAANRRQRLVRRLAVRPALFRRTLGALPAGLRPGVRDEVLARRELASIHSVVVQRPALRIGPPTRASALRRHYRRAWRRFGVGWPLLAAVHFVETRFGRLRNESTAGARGPMQFMPATWAAYGLGGDVHDPRDAILGAANLLRANGAPRDEARALMNYNRSTAYVSAVRRYARRMRADPHAFYAYHAWNVRHLRRR